MSILHMFIHSFSGQILMDCNEQTKQKSLPLQLKWTLFLVRSGIFDMLSAKGTKD